MQSLDFCYHSNFVDQNQEKTLTKMCEMTCRFSEQFGTGVYFCLPAGHFCGRTSVRLDWLDWTNYLDFSFKNLDWSYLVQIISSYVLVCQLLSGISL
jgi:hypothetical protein